MVRSRSLQLFDRLPRLVVAEREECAKHRQVTERDGRVVRKTRSEIVRERLRLHRIARDCQRKRDSILHFAVPGQREGRRRALRGRTPDSKAEVLSRDRMGAHEAPCRDLRSDRMQAMRLVRPMTA